MVKIACGAATNDLNERLDVVPSSLAQLGSSHNENTSKIHCANMVDSLQNIKGDIHGNVSNESVYLANDNCELMHLNSSTSTKSVTFRAGSPDIFLISQQNYLVDVEEYSQNYIKCDLNTSKNHQYHKPIIAAGQVSFDTSAQEDSQKCDYSHFTDVAGPISSKNDLSVIGVSSMQQAVDSSIQNSTTHHVYGQLNKEPASFLNGLESCSRTNIDLPDNIVPILSTDINNHASLVSTCLSPIPFAKSYFLQRDMKQDTNVDEKCIPVDFSEDMVFGDGTQMSCFVDDIAGDQCEHDVNRNSGPCISWTHVDCTDSNVAPLSCSINYIKGNCFVLLVQENCCYIFLSANNSRQWKQIGQQSHNLSALDVER